MRCSTCGCRGAEVLLQRMRCLNRHCYMHDLQHLRRYGLARGTRGKWFRFSGDLSTDVEADLDAAESAARTRRS